MKKCNKKFTNTRIKVINQLFSRKNRNYKW